MKKLLLILLGICCTSLSFSLYAQQAKKEKGTVTEEVIAPEIKLYVYNNTVYVNNAPVGAKLQIITLLGSRMREIEITDEEFSQVLNLPKAIYIFKLEGKVWKAVIR